VSLTLYVILSVLINYNDFFEKLACEVMVDNLVQLTTSKF